MLDQTTAGDQWHVLIAAVPLFARMRTYVRLTSSQGICLANALHVIPHSRYNNGQPAATVRLQPMDGIVLQSDAAGLRFAVLRLRLAFCRIVCRST